MMTRLEAEQILRAAASGQHPERGDTLVFSERGWEFGKVGFLGTFSEDPESESGQFWFNVAEGKMRLNAEGIIFESAAWTPL